jgi:hypothetical protein
LPFSANEQQASFFKYSQMLHYSIARFFELFAEQASNRRKCIGKVDPVTGDIIPSKKTMNAEASLPK